MLVATDWITYGLNLPTSNTLYIGTLWSTHVPSISHVIPLSHVQQIHMF